MSPAGCYIDSLEPCALYFVPDLSYLAVNGHVIALPGAPHRAVAPCDTMGSMSDRDASVRAWAGGNCGGGSPLVVRPMTWLVLGASAAILVLAFLLWRHAAKRLAALGLAGEVIYSDGGSDDEVLVSHRHRLTGKLLITSAGRAQEERRSEQKRFDRETRRMSSETTAEKQHRLQEVEKQRRREFAFLSEIPDLFDLRFEGDSTVEGRSVWVVSGAPRPGGKAKSSDAKMLLKLRGRMWIDKATYQWARVEAETTDTISWGLFLARLNPGAKMIFEQTEVNSELWFPKRLLLTGSGRVGIVKRLAQENEIGWSNYKKFSVDSKIVTGQPLNPKN